MPEDSEVTIRSQKKGKELIGHPLELSKGEQPPAALCLESLRPRVLWHSILATTRQEPAVFSERPTDVSYFPVPSTLQKAGVGNHPCSPAGIGERVGRWRHRAEGRHI